MGETKLGRELVSIEPHPTIAKRFDVTYMFTVDGEGEVFKRPIRTVFWGKDELEVMQKFIKFNRERSNNG
jgi:hypothetical protein